MSIFKFKRTLIETRKFYIRGNNFKVGSIEKGCIVIAHLLPQDDLEKYTTLF